MDGDFDHLVRGTNYEDVREHNLSRVLSIVHRSGSVSRRDITRMSGLSRSAVKGLVGELQHLGLCLEVEPEAATRAGRPSPTVLPDPRVHSVAVNRDASGVEVAVARMGGSLAMKTSRPLDRTASAATSADVVADVLRDFATRLPTGASLVGIGAAVPGYVDESDSEGKTYAPSISWQGEPFGRCLSEATGIPTEVRFDAHLGVVAESIWGSGRGVGTLCYLYGGPGGVGASAMMDGHLVRGGHGTAAAMAHVVVVPGGRECVCGGHGCFQAEVTQAELLALVGQGRFEPAEFARKLASSHPPEVSDRLDEVVTATGLLIRQTMTSFDPELIILDGFLAQILEAFGERLLPWGRRFITRSRVQQPRLEASRFGSDLLLVGAADLGFRRLVQTPRGASSS